MREVKLLTSLFFLALCSLAAAQNGNNTNSGDFTIDQVVAIAVGTFIGGIVVGALSTLVVSCIVYSQYCCVGRIRLHSKRYVKQPSPRDAEPTEVYNEYTDDSGEKENAVGSKEYEFLPIEMEKKKSKKEVARHVGLSEQTQFAATPPPPSYPPPATELPPITSESKKKAARHVGLSEQMQLAATPPPPSYPPPATELPPVTNEPEHEPVSYDLPEVAVKQKRLPEQMRKKERKNIPLAPVTMKMRQPITPIPIPPPQRAKPRIASPESDPEQQYSASQLDGECESSYSEHYYVMDANKAQEFHKQQQETSARYLD